MLPGKWSEWEVIGDIGYGSYGTVYQIEKDDEIKAVKIIEIPQQDEYPLIMKEHGQDAEAYCRSIAQDFETEIVTLTSLEDCKNIISVKDYVVEKKKDDIGWVIYIFMDCLSSFVEYASMRELSEEDMIKLALEITNALVACEKKGIIHRDIKPENILVTDDGHYMLCDFGLARELNYRQLINSVKGTYKYMAPEVYHGQKYTNSVDIYSLGLILYQYMNNRREVFIPLDKDTIYYRDQEKALEKRMENYKIPEPCNASEEFADIILRMIAYNPEERYDSAEKLYRDLVLLKEGKYRKKYGLLHYKKHITAFLLGVTFVAGFGAWFQWPVYKDVPCGPSAVSRLTNGGTLVISGKGDVTDSSKWFDYEDSIKRVIVEDGIENFNDDSTFEYCTNLKIVKLPEGLKTLANNAFAECEKLDTINIPKSLEYCGSNAFTNTKWSRDNADENGLVIRNNIILDYVVDKNVKDKNNIVIPEGVEYLGSDIFQYHEEIRSITFPDSLEYIEANALCGCENLEKVIGGKNIVSIGEDAFFNTKYCDKELWPSLNGILLGYNGFDKEVTIPESIHTLGACCLKNKNSLYYAEKVIVPEHVKKISDSAFKGNTAVRSIIIKSEITELERSVFAECENLEDVVLPATIKTIYPLAFYRCSNLKTVRIPKDTLLVNESEWDRAVTPFTECKAEIIWY